MALHKLKCPMMRYCYGCLCIRLFTISQAKTSLKFCELWVPYLNDLHSSVNNDFQTFSVSGWTKTLSKPHVSIKYSSFTNKLFKQQILLIILYKKWTFVPNFNRALKKKCIVLPLMAVRGKLILRRQIPFISITIGSTLHQILILKCLENIIYDSSDKLLFCNHTSYHIQTPEKIWTRRMIKRLLYWFFSSDIVMFTFLWEELSPKGKMQVGRLVWWPGVDESLLPSKATYASGPPGNRLRLPPWSGVSWWIAGGKTR